MRFGILGRAIVLGAILASPVAGYAQESTITGTVTDSTGAVLPGVTVVAVHEATGNQFEGVTDGRGAYRIPVRVGTYRMTAELSGFTRIERMGVQLLVGQTVTMNVQMSPSTIQETVTVTGEAPLSATRTGAPRTTSSTARCRSRTSSTAPPSAAQSCAIGSITSRTTNTTARRSPRSREPPSPISTSP